MEVFSKLAIGDFPRKFGPFLETRWEPRFLSIPDNPFNVMEDVEGLLYAARLLLDAWELGHMLEPVCTVIPENFLLLFEGASLFGVALESLIENTLYSGEISLHNQIPRVEISGNGPPVAQDNEHAVLVPAQHN